MLDHDVDNRSRPTRPAIVIAGQPPTLGDFNRGDDEPAGGQAEPGGARVR